MKNISISPYSIIGATVGVAIGHYVFRSSSLFPLMILGVVGGVIANKIDKNIQDKIIKITKAIKSRYNNNEYKVRHTLAEGVRHKIEREDKEMDHYITRIAEEGICDSAVAILIPAYSGKSQKIICSDLGIEYGYIGSTIGRVNKKINENYKKHNLHLYNLDDLVAFLKQPRPGF